jgi:hypothetical protein
MAREGRVHEKAQTQPPPAQMSSHLQKSNGQCLMTSSICGVGHSCGVNTSTMADLKSAP